MEEEKTKPRKGRGKEERREGGKEGGAIFSTVRYSTAVFRGGAKKINDFFFE